jgi:hypothetical protein
MPVIVFITVTVCQLCRASYVQGSARYGHISGIRYSRHSSYVDDIITAQAQKKSHAVMSAALQASLFLIYSGR